MHECLKNYYKTIRSIWKFTSLLNRNPSQGHDLDLCSGGTAAASSGLQVVLHLCGAAVVALRL